MVVAAPESPKHLGFEAQRFLASRLDSEYDLYAYFEDDLIILDPWFFRKIDWFRSQAGNDCVVFPIELSWPLNPTLSIDFLSMDPCLNQTCVKSCRIRRRP